MDARISSAATECGEKETERMQKVTKKAMQDSADLYEFLSGRIQPEIGVLMSASIKHHKEFKASQLYVDSIQDYTDRVILKNKHLQQVVLLTHWFHYTSPIFNLFYWGIYFFTIIRILHRCSR